MCLSYSDGACAQYTSSLLSNQERTHVGAWSGDSDEEVMVQYILGFGVLALMETVLLDPFIEQG